MPDFDPTVYYLGSLCKRGHDWHDTGKSLRYLKHGSHCRVCKYGTKNVLTSTPLASEDTPYYDPEKFVLGKLCVNGHEWGHTGGTLRDSKFSWCPECYKATCNASYHRNRSIRAVRAKAYREVNRDKISQSKRMNYNANLEVNRAKKKAQRTAWEKKNPEKIKAIDASYRERNRLKIKKYHKEAKRWGKAHVKERTVVYKRENRDKINATERRRLANNPSLRLSRNISRRIYYSLAGGKQRRGWQSIVGWTLEQLIVHLESQFEPWMTWENYGTRWHIDHVVPLSAFRFVGPDDPEIKRAYALSNLRPLEAVANIRKGNSLVLVFPRERKRG